MFEPCDGINVYHDSFRFHILDAFVLILDAIKSAHGRKANTYFEALVFSLLFLMKASQGRRPDDRYLTMFISPALLMVHHIATVHMTVYSPSALPF